MRIFLHHALSSNRYRTAHGCSAVGVLLAITIGCERSSPPVAAPAPGATSHQTADPALVAEENESVESDTSVADNDEPDSDRVLRHAVFFAFKETSSAQDVQGVVDAFAALPEKIDSITDFQWGTNNSPEKLDDGFTHCFLLSFRNETDRDAYIPHPAHKGEFADALRPHMKDVFVIDYWGKQPQIGIEKELKHAVFFKFKDEASPEDVKKVEEAFAALPSKIDSIKAFEWGKNISPERNDDGFTHCFMVTFDSEEGREQYLPHADHQAFVEVLKPVLDKVRVLDFWDQTTR